MRRPAAGGRLEACPEPVEGGMVMVFTPNAASFETMHFVPLLRSAAGNEIRLMP